MKTKTIKQKAIIPASPEKVYKALLSSKEHAAFTGAEAKISAKQGGFFSAHGGYITGKNLKLVKGKKIIQTWKATEPNWPETHFSEVIFELKKKGNGTEIIFTHNEVPAVSAKTFADGWKQYYWIPMKKYFKSKK